MRTRNIGLLLVLSRSITSPSDVVFVKGTGGTEGRKNSPPSRPAAPDRTRTLISQIERQARADANGNNDRGRGEATVTNTDTARASGAQQHQRPIRLAIVRPFGLEHAPSLPETFDSWNDFPPCRDGKRNNGDDGDNADDEANDDGTTTTPPYVVDLYLSFSQTYASAPEALKSIHGIVQQFRQHKDANSAGSPVPSERSFWWGDCINLVYPIEANIKPDEDVYQPYGGHQETLDTMWVNGPNRHFERSFRYVQKANTLRNHEGQAPYDAMFIMETDNVPIKPNWLDRLVEEISSSRPFAILGSKYDGDSWDNFLDQIPLPLRNHINGNAVYNVSHPYLHEIVGQLEREARTLYNGIGYDYRISQIVMEGSHGIKPDLPRALTEVPDDYLAKDNAAKFEGWWNDYGTSGGGGGAVGDGGRSLQSSVGNSPFKTSKVISNYAATNILPRHLGDATIIHGARMHQPWSMEQHGITLVVSEWDDNHAEHLLRDLENSNHPFQEVVVMVPTPVSFRPQSPLSSFTIPIKVRMRTQPDYMDICSAPITTEWFMLTNCYHTVAQNVDLLFTTDGTNRPVVPYTPSQSTHCVKYEACQETLRVARTYFSRSFDKIILEGDVLINTKARNDYCRKWKDTFGEGGEGMVPVGKRLGPRGPTATSYVAHLDSLGIARDIYDFSDRTAFGSRDNFVRMLAEAEDMNAELYGTMDDYVHSIDVRRMLQPSASPPLLPGGSKCREDSECISGRCHKQKCKGAKLSFAKQVNPGSRRGDDGSSAVQHSTASVPTSEKSSGIYFAWVGLLIVGAMVMFGTFVRHHPSDHEGIGDGNM